MLGHYGMGTGAYVMLPGYGAATPRQDLGHLVDMTYPMLSLLGPWRHFEMGEFKEWINEQAYWIRMHY